MILGTAAGLPVVACVATRDRLSMLLECPYCSDIHTHGGHGLASPGGAADGGRHSHCTEADMGDRIYVIKEVPGKASVNFANESPDAKLVKAITYDRAGIARLQPEIAALIERYERSWAGPNVRIGRDPGDIAYLRGQVPWPAAYYGLEPLAPGSAPFPVDDDTLEQILYRFYDRAGRLLYIGITGDAATRWSNHSKKQPWWPSVRRIEIEPYATRIEVELAEKAAIRAEKPLHNKVHNTSNTTRLTKPREGYATDPQHYTDACHTCFGMWPAVEMDWRADGLDTLHRCDAGHQWTCSWSKSPFIYEDCECDWCRWMLRKKRAA